MAETELDFEIAADPDALTAYLSVPELLGKVLPFVDHTDNEGNWVVKDQQAKVTQTRKLVPTLTVESGGIVQWVGKGEKLTSTLRFEIRRKDRVSRVNCRLKMEIEGPLGIVLAPIISLNVRNQIEAIARGLKEEFADNGAAANECHACPICGKS